MTTFYLDKIDLPERAKETVLAVYEKTKDLPELASFDKLLFNADVGSTNQDADALLESICVKCSLHRYQLNLAVAVLFADIAKQNYIKNGHTDEVFFEATRDFSVKVYECVNLFGIYGCKSFLWFVPFFAGKRFYFGRLQYNLSNLPIEKCTFGDTTITSNDVILDIHIPSGKKLSPESVIDSLCRAYDYFADLRIDGLLYFCCNCWLLYSGYKDTIFKRESNLYKFADIFKIISSFETASFSDAWRVFNTNDISDLDSLPVSTSLQRRFVEYIRHGGKFGRGIGILAVDENGLLDKNGK